MKALDVKFPHPIKILQVFRNSYLYTKSVRQYSQRKEIRTWDMQSKSGYVANGELYLPEEFITNADLDNCTVMTMEDYNYTRQKGVFYGHKREVTCGNKEMDLAEPERNHIFRLQQGSDLELYLDAEGVKWRNPDFPLRESFKISNLRPGEPVEIKINFKFFNPLQGTMRFLEEETYIYEYIGDFDRCHLLRDPYDVVKKDIPGNRKVVNLLKQLWM